MERLGRGVGLQVWGRGDGLSPGFKGICTDIVCLRVEVCLSGKSAPLPLCRRCKIWEALFSAMVHVQLPSFPYS